MIGPLHATNVVVALLRAGNDPNFMPQRMAFVLRLKSPFNLHRHGGMAHQAKQEVRL